LASSFHFSHLPVILFEIVAIHLRNLPNHKLYEVVRGEWTILEKVYARNGITYMLLARKNFSEIKNIFDTRNINGYYFS